jgi:hypothetical protein
MVAYASIRLLGTVGAGMSGAAATPAGWIGGRRNDLFFFFGGSAVAGAVGLVLLLAPALVVPVWWAWLFLVDGPHLFATWTRSYLDPDDRRKYGGLLVWSLLAFVPGAVAWAILAGTGERTPFDLFLLLATLWAYFHAIRQQYGILAVYHRLDATPAASRRLDSWFLQGALWAMYLLLMLAHPASREALKLPPALSGGSLVAALSACGVLTLATLFYVASIAMRRRAGHAVRPALFVLLPVVALQAFAVFVVGSFEPLMEGPAHIEQFFLAAAVVGGIPHGLQYLGIVFAANRRRYAAAPRAGIVPRLGASPRLAYAFLLVLAAGYLALNAVREGSPLPASFATGALPSAGFLALYWGLFFHHYWLDQYLWRPSRDPQLRSELGLA